MNVEREAAELIERVYDTVLDPSGWTALLEHLCAVVGSDTATLLLHDLHGRGGGVQASAHFDPDALRAYGEHYASVNPWFAGREADLQPGCLFASWEELPNAKLVKTEFYSDFLRPLDILYSMNLVLFRDEELAGNLTMERSKARGVFTSRERAILTRLTPHLQRALEVQRRLSVSAAGDVVGSVELLGHAAFVLDFRGVVVHMNARARELLDEGDGVRLTPLDVLVGVAPSSAARFSRLVESTRRSLLGGTRGPGGSVVLQRRGRRPLAALVSQLPSPAVPRASSPAVIVLVADGESGAEVSPALLQHLYGLTPAEARLACLLSTGMSLAEAAERSQVKVQTARTQLKQVFAKTDTHRQAELVSLLLRSRLPVS